LTKRVCETCRFFQEAGFAKNGWCNHPQRKESSDVKIVVRRNDLPCRNGWAQDFWTPPAEEGDEADIVLHDTVSARPVKPASVEELTFLVNAQRDKSHAPESPPPSGMPVDVVVGEVPSTKPTNERQPLLAQDPRTAILRAREQYRARMNAELRQHDPARYFSGVASAGASASAPPTPSVIAAHSDVKPASSSAPRGQRREEVPPVQLSEISRDFPTITTFPEDEVKFSSIPERVAGISLPRPTTPARAPLKAPAGMDHAETDESPPTPSSTETRAEPIRPRLATDAARPVDQVAHDALRPGTEIAVLDASSRGSRTRPDQLDWRRSEPATPVAGSDVTAEAWEEPVSATAPAPPMSAGIEAPAIDDHFEDVNPAIEIAPDVPRMCRTCRDFRPADSGERGWCTNKWAFTHRRMVDADELPCETSIGCWWLPHDDHWLVTADVSAHGQPTPLVDHWLAHKVGLATSGAAAGDQRRRQRS
jgi:hypothetical protein